MAGNLDAQKAGWMTGYADGIVSHLMRGPRAPDLAWDDVRDMCNQRTAGDLDCFRLDLLTDMVMQRLNGPA